MTIYLVQTGCYLRANLEDDQEVLIIWIAWHLRHHRVRHIPYSKRLLRIVSIYFSPVLGANP
jgi:hypothetical protein